MNRQHLTFHRAFKPIPIMTKLALLFVRATTTYDELPDGWCIVKVSKTFRGVCYVLESKKVLLPPRHWNCRCAIQ